MLLVKACKEEMGTLQHLYCSRSLQFNIGVLESFLDSLLATFTGGQESLVKIFAPVAASTISVKLRFDKLCFCANKLCFLHHPAQ